MSDKVSSVHYINYLSLDKLLDSQLPLSGGGKDAASRGNVIYHNSPNL